METGHGGWAHEPDGRVVSETDPAVRLARELDRAGCREALARLEQARRRHERAVIAEISIDEHGVVQVEVRRRFGRLRERLIEDAAYEKRLLEEVEAGEAELLAKLEKARRERNEGD